MQKRYYVGYGASLRLSTVLKAGYRMQRQECLIPHIHVLQQLYLSGLVRLAGNRPDAEI